MKYLNQQILVYINKQVIMKSHEKYLGIQFPQGLSLVIRQPQMVLFNHELYPTIWLKSAYILQKITKKHIFKDGNKRTAYIATKLFLLLNNYHLYLSTGEIIALMLSATTKLDSDKEMIKIANFLKRHSKRIDN